MSLLSTEATGDVIEGAKRLLRAGWHPIQLQAFTILSDREASPKEIAIELGLTKAKAGYVSRHVKELESRGLVILKRTEPRRGANEHYYRAVAPLIVDNDQAEEMSLEERLSLSCWIVSCISHDFLRAIGAGTIDERIDRHLTRSPMLVAEEGYQDLFRLHEEAFERTMEIKEAAERRLAETGEQGIAVSAVLAIFPMPNGRDGVGEKPYRMSSLSTKATGDVIEAAKHLLRSGWHPIQLQAFTILSDREASPKEIAIELGLTKAKAGYVSHHVKELLKRGLIVLKRTAPRRGASEHYYRAVAPLIVDADQAEEMSFEERLSFSCWIVSCISHDFLRAIETGTIDERIDRHLTRTPLLVDGQGYRELFELHEEAFERTMEINEAAERQLEEASEEGIPVSAVIASFPMPMVSAR